MSVGGPQPQITHPPVVGVVGDWPAAVLCICGWAAGVAGHAAHHAAWEDAMRDHAESRSVPVQRPDHDVLVSIAQLLQELLAETRRTNARLGSAAESRSSVELKTSTRGVDIATKAYAGSDILEAESAAVASYFRVLNEVQDRLTGATRS